MGSITINLLLCIMGLNTCWSLISAGGFAKVKAAVHKLTGEKVKFQYH